MDKQTLSNYGWIVIVTLILAVMLALATPFGNYVGRGVAGVTNALIETMGGAVDEDSISNKSQEWEKEFINYKDKGNEDIENVVTKLSTPQLSLSGSILTITPVENANAYEIYNGDKFLTITTATKFNLYTNIKTSGTYTIGVIATSGTHGVSEKATIKYNATNSTYEHNGVVYTGAVYRQANGTQLQENMPFPELTNGDEYICGDYRYIYYDTNGGWNVRVKGHTSELTDTFLTSVNGKPVVSMKDFAQDQKITVTDYSMVIIPSTVTTMYHAFYGDTYIVTPPLIIPESVRNIEAAFRGCTSLKTAPEIRSPELYLKYAFDGCSSLGGDLIIHTQTLLKDSNIGSAQDKFLELSTPGKTITIKGNATAEIKKKLANTSSSKYRSIIVE